MSAHPDRKPGHLYVRRRQYANIEDHEGRTCQSAAPSIDEGDAAEVWEFPDPAAHAALVEERDELDGESRLYARIVEAVSEALGQEFTETRHDLGEKVAALGEERDAHYAESCEIAVRLGEQRQRAENAEAKVARLRAALEACEQEFITSRHAAQGEHRLAGVVRAALRGEGE